MESQPVTQIVTTFRRLVTSLMLAALLAAPLFSSSTGTALAAGGQPGAVYVMTNAATGNAIVFFNRSADGSLVVAGTVSTGGLGSGSGLGSQGALMLSDNQRWLFAVNAGSNDISVFAVQPEGLQLVARTVSGGVRPVSITMNRKILYVLNAGGSGNISGFTFDSKGNLLPLSGSTRPLSNDGIGAAPGPAQVSFSPDGRQLVVTEKATNLIVTFQVEQHGLASSPTTHPSAGATPFGFAFSKRDTLVVSEAFGGAPNASAVSSYTLDDGNVQVINPSVPTHQTAACWVVITANGKYAYTTNAGSGSISGYRLTEDGSLSLLNSDGQTGQTGPGSTPVDAALSRNSQFLYVLTAGAHAIVTFQIGSDGTLTPLNQVVVPVGAAGIAAS